MPLKILIADDHEIVRKGLRNLLESGTGWVVCGEAADGREAVEQVLALGPDVVVLDIGMPRMSGVEAARRIADAAPRTAVVILSAHHTEEVVREVFAAGAKGYVLKSDAGVDLVAAVDAVAKARTFFSAKIAEVVQAAMRDGGTFSRRPAAESPLTQLTAREREVLQLLAEGRTTKEVAADLGIGVKTAETHRARLMKKLGLRSIGELVLYAIRNHIVQP